MPACLIRVHFINVKDKDEIIPAIYKTRAFQDFGFYDAFAGIRPVQKFENLSSFLAP
jgi:hypothetical protein